MDGTTVTDLDSIVAPLNFLVPMTEKPVAYNYDPPPGAPVRTGKNIEYQVAIRNARPLINQLSLDKEGFVLLHHQTAVTNFYDEEQIRSIYYPECERVMQQATGAARVVAFDHIVRNAAMSAKDKAIKIPAKRVHNDYTAWSAPQRVRDLMGDEAEELLKHRFAINNLWRPIRGPVLESPLTLCDAQSLSEENLIASDLKYPDRTGETYAITYNPDQRYYYFPKMQADEVVLIRCYDSARRGFPPIPALTTRLRHPMRRRAKASKFACWCSSRPAPRQARHSPSPEPSPRSREREGEGKWPRTAGLSPQAPALPAAAPAIVRR